MTSYAILKVDCRAKRATKETITPAMRERFLGGVGINTWLLLDSEASSHHPLAPQNRLIFGCGAMCGSRLLAANRLSVTARSPLTGIYGDSNAGGNFPVWMHQAGYENMVFDGAADEPFYLLIDSRGEIHFESAEDIWGLDSYAATDWLKHKHGRCEIACIGRAGEQLVHYANIIFSKYHVAGRTGMGAVMGSKKIKAIVILPPQTKCQPADPTAIGHIRQTWLDICNKSFLSMNTKLEGSLFLMEKYNTLSLLPVENCQRGQDDQAQELYTVNFDVNHSQGPVGCHSCPIVCGRKYTVQAGRLKGETSERIDYGAAVSLGPAFGLYQWDDVLALKIQIDRYGVDAMELGGCLSLVLETNQRGITELKNDHGELLEYGRIDDIFQLLEWMDQGNDIGLALRRGTQATAQELGAQKYAFCVKGSSTGTHAKSRYAWSLGYLTSTRGGDHLKNFPFSMLFGGYFSDMVAKYIFDLDAKQSINQPDDKGRVVWWHENFKYSIDALGFCLFAFHSLPNLGHGFFDDMARALNAFHGTTLDEREVFRAAERIYQLQNAFNVRCGQSLADYAWPQRQPDEGISPEYIDLTTLEERDHPGMLPEYFSFRGLDESGRPSAARFEQIGLDDFINWTSLRQGGLSFEEALNHVRLVMKMTPFDSFKVHVMSALFRRLIAMGMKRKVKQFKQKRDQEAAS